jgi:hypothetical protein
MESGLSHASSSSEFPFFLRLPREIRDLVIEHILVRDTIPIECAIAKPSSTRVPRIFDELNNIYPLRSPHAHRRLWSMPMFDMNLDYTDSNRDKPMVIYMTYQIAHQNGSSSSHRLNLSLLQVSKQVYAEASKIFYRNNIFSFTGDYRIPTAFAFLCDRPATSLRLIESLELALIEDNNMRGTPHAHYPILRRSTDSLVLQYAYHYYTELCTLLSTPRTRLRRLFLTVETLSVRGAGHGMSLQDSVTFENDNLVDPQLDAPLWLDPLLKIDGLDSVEICWIFRQPRMKRMTYMAGIISQNMLTNTQSDSDGQAACNPRSSALLLHVLHKVEGIDPSTTNDSWSWEEFTLDGDILQHMIKGNDNTIDSIQSSRTRPHLECTLEPYPDVYVCFCTLSHA